MPLNGSWLMINIPVDIFRGIFSFCIDAGPVSFPLRGTPMQLTLSQVCSFWRKIMLDTPSAWNDVMVGPFSDYDQACDISSRMDEWLSRSGDSLISLDLGTLIEARPRTTQDLLHKYRFKKLRMITPTDQLSTLFLIPAENLCHVEELTMFQGYTGEKSHYQRSDSRSRGLGKRPFFPRHEFPLLKTLTTDVNPAIHDVVHALSWGQLRRLDMRADMPLVPCMDILRQCPLLETLNLEMVSSPLIQLVGQPSPKSDAEPLLLSHLNELYIEFVRSDICDKMLGMLILPELKTLSLFYVASEPAKLGSLEGLVTGRLGPQLQALNVKDSLDITLILDIIETRCKISARDGSDPGHAFQAPQATLKLIDLSDADVSGSDQERIDILRAKGLEINTRLSW